MSSDRVTFAPNAVVGLGLALMGVALLLDRAGILDAGQMLTYWPVLLILFGAAVMWQAIQGSDAAANGKRPRPIIGPGLVLILVIGSILGSQAWERRDRFEQRVSSEDAPSLFSVMGKTHSVSHSRNFKGGDVTSVMGGARLDLRDAMMAPGEEATVDVFGVMGEVEILVPEGWVVDVRVQPVMGGVKDSRPFQRSFDEVDRAERDADIGTPASPGAPPAAADAKETATPVEAPGDGRPAPRLVVRGFVMMAALKIRS
jgi:predicted membrane protein